MSRLVSTHCSKYVPVADIRVLLKDSITSLNVVLPKHRNRGQANLSNGMDKRKFRNERGVKNFIMTYKVVLRVCVLYPVYVLYFSHQRRHSRFRVQVHTPYYWSFPRVHDNPLWISVLFSVVVIEKLIEQPHWTWPWRPWIFTEPLNTGQIKLSKLLFQKQECPIILRGWGKIFFAYQIIFVFFKIYKNGICCPVFFIFLLRYHSSSVGTLRVEPPWFLIISIR